MLSPVDGSGRAHFPEYGAMSEAGGWAEGRPGGRKGYCRLEIWMRNIAGAHRGACQVSKEPLEVVRR